MRRKVLIAAIALLDAAVVVHLAGSWAAAAMFAAFVALIVMPAITLVPAPLVIFAAVPWFFLRKAVGMPLVVDIVTAAVLIALALRPSPRRAGRRCREAADEGRHPAAIAPHPALRATLSPLRGARDLRPRLPLLTFVVVPILFALVWLGWHVPVGNEVRFYGLFGIDFGNLVAVVSTLRASPMLPLSYVAGGGPLSYHWLYFTIPAALADFGGGSMPNANALILVNLLVAMLLVQAVASIASEKIAAAIVLFAPFTTYFYQAIAGRIALGPLAVPFRNHLLLSPLNSMVAFGNNTVALVLAIAALVSLERWNAEGKLRDLVAGCVALAAIAGFSITLVFPLTIAFFVWTLLGRVRRLWLALGVAVVAGAAALAIFGVLHVIGGDSTRHLAVAFDRGAFLKMVIFGMVPLWLLARWRPLTIYHVVIGACVAVPTMLYLAGSPTGASDFSMKIASLMAVAFAPLIVVRRALMVAVVAGAGLIQSAAYVLQFPYYRLRHDTKNGVAVPRDYANAQAWIRDHTPRSAVVVDPHELRNRDEIFTLILAERRVWLPTAYAKTYLIHSLPQAAIAERETMPPEAMARQADVLLVPYAPPSAAWRPVFRQGAWVVFRSTLR